MLTVHSLTKATTHTIMLGINGEPRLTAQQQDSPPDEKSKSPTPTSEIEDTDYKDDGVKEDENDKKDAESKKEQNTKDEVHEDKDKREAFSRDQKSPPAKTPASTFEEKQRQLLLADCQRLKKKMTKVRTSIERPPLKPFTPYLFNSLEPYYNQYIVNYVASELQDEEEERPKTNYGQRATSLGIVEPQVSWRMDNVPGPFRSTRLQTSPTMQKKWTGTTHRDTSLGSTRLPTFPKPSFPKINIPEYSASRMDYSKVLKFRIEMDRQIENLNKKKVQMDYDRTLKDWERMNLNELKELPPYSRYHVSKAIKTYFGTSKGATRAVNSLSKQLEVE